MLELNKIYCMDCLEGMKRIPDNSIDLVVADPPYNIGKDKWDKVNNYYEWLSNVFIECSRVLKSNGTLWFFHISFPDLSQIHQMIVDKTALRHKQLIIIDKGLGSVAGRCNIEMLRSFPRATEYIQFYTFEDITGSEQLSDTYSKCNPMAKYLRDEFKRAGVSNREIAQLFPSRTGGMTGCVSNWLLGLNFPLKEQYEKMRKFLNNEYLKQEYEYLKQEYENLKQEYENLRYSFNLPLRTTDVWRINFYKDNVMGHCTIKPIEIVRRIIETSSKAKNVVLDPFMGSGTTAVACKQLNRNFIGFEIEPKYVEIANNRLKQSTLNDLTSIPPTRERAGILEGVL